MGGDVVARREVDDALTPESVERATPGRQSSSQRRWLMVVATLIGPGMLVMLADTDAGSVITAAQSGALYRFGLVLPELLLIPILYVVQEITVRVGITTGKGHGALIREYFGAPWAYTAAVTLLVACAGALVTEFAGIAGVGLLVGLPKAVTVGAAALGLTALIIFGRYRRIEAIGIVVGALELLFVVAAIDAHPNVSALARSLTGDWTFSHGYGTLLAATVGAVIMPWMIFYQQEAVIDKGYRERGRAGLADARTNTFIGAVVTQLIMIAIVVVSGATLGTLDAGRPLNDVGSIATALTPFLGHRDAVVLFGLGMIGASVVAALVVSVAGAWGIAEVFGWKHSLNDPPATAIRFYGVAVAGIVASALAVVVATNLVGLAVDVEVMNAALLPVVLTFLVLLERRLPAPVRMRGARRILAYAMIAVVVAVGFVTIASVIHTAL